MTDEAANKSPIMPCRWRYAIITPVRDEEQYVGQTIQSVRGQTVRPICWVLVNDGSRDRTGEIINRWAAEEPWIVPVHRSRAEVDDSKGTSRKVRASRALEAKEILAFHEGYRRVNTKEWDFLIKLDGDLSFEPDYFERCFREFDNDPHLGIGGGEVYNLLGHTLQREHTPRFHVRGATKIYRRACWDDIGGVIAGPGWDTLDEIEANRRGWSTRTFDGPSLIHLRFTGTANGAWGNAVKNGVWSYVAGYHPVYMAIRCARQLFRRPILFGSVGLAYGFLYASLRGVSRGASVETTQYLQKQQLRRLLNLRTIWK
jgi:glycosyltransferase involved in cell wall biosynthesis